jgi:hypothetical protein
MRSRARQTRENRTITVDFQNEATYVQLLDDGKAFLECVMAFLLALGFQLTHKAAWSGGGCLTRHSHYVRVRLGGLTIWRIQCTTCKAVFTVLPHCVLRYRKMRPDMARDALIATHGGLSLEWCAVICHTSPMALSRVICAFGQHSVVTVLPRCGLPWPRYILADEKHSRCLTERVSLPTIVSGRVIGHLGYSASKSAAAFTASYGEFHRVASQEDPSYQVKGALTDGFDSTVSSMRALLPGVRLGYCLRHALNKLPSKLLGVSAPVRQGLRAKFHALLHRCRQRKSLRVVALGQRLRHFAEHIATTVGEAPGKRGRQWFQAKKAGLVCGARRPAEAGDEHRAGSSAQRHRPQTLRHARLPPSRWESSGVSHRPGAPVQLNPLSAPGPERGQVWGGSGGRSRPDSGLDAQPANPHVGRLSVCASASPPLNSGECGNLHSGCNTAGARDHHWDGHWRGDCPIRPSPDRHSPGSGRSAQRCRPGGGAPAWARGVGAALRGRAGGGWGRAHRQHRGAYG